MIVYKPVSIRIKLSWIQNKKNFFLHWLKTETYCSFIEKKFGGRQPKTSMVAPQNWQRPAYFLAHSQLSLNWGAHPRGTRWLLSASPSNHIPPRRNGKAALLRSCVYFCLHLTGQNWATYLHGKLGLSSFSWMAIHLTDEEGENVYWEALSSVDHKSTGRQLLFFKRAKLRCSHPIATMWLTSQLTHSYPPTCQQNCVSTCHGLLKYSQLWMLNSKMQSRLFGIFSRSPNCTFLDTNYFLY